MSSRMNKIRNGKFVGDGADKRVVLGYQPKVVKLYNITDQADYVKLQTMEDAKARKEVAAGTKTYPADAVEINSDGFTLKAAENTADSTFHYAAYESQSES